MIQIKAKSLPTSLKILVLIFLLSGTVHLVNPGVFEALIPPTGPTFEAKRFSQFLKNLVVLVHL
jgi:uncharacterized membrane protein